MNAFSIWLMPNGSIEILHNSIEEYNDFAITSGPNARVWRKPDPHATFLMAALGDNIQQWDYRIKFASEPINGAKTSVVTGIVVYGQLGNDYTLEQIYDIEDNHKSVTFDAASSGLADNASSITVSHTTADQSNRRAIGLVTGRSGQTIDSFTYNGDSLTELDETDTGVGPRAAVYSMVAPDVGTANFVCTFSGATSGTAGLVTVYGAEQSIPSTTVVNNSAINTGPNISGVASAVGDMVLSVTCWNHANGSITNTPDATWTTMWNINSQTTGNDRGGTGARITGSTTVGRTDSLSDADWWLILAISINASSDTSTPINFIGIDKMVGINKIHL